jgi:hypothetical protein
VAKTLLQIVNAVQGELGLPIAATVVGNSDATTTQLLYLANRCIDELRREHPTGWQVCQFEHNIVVEAPIETTGDLTQNSPIITNIPDTSSITVNLYVVSGDGIPQAARVVTVATSVATQLTMNMEYTGDTTTGADLVFARDTYAMPTDYDWTQNQTHWDRTNYWSLIGPDSPQVWQWHQSGIVSTGPRRHFRQFGTGSSTWHIWPAPFEITDPLQLVFEYLSINAVMATGGTYKQYFTADTDVPILDDQAIITGMKWMFFEIKGFNVISMKNSWIDYVQKLIGRDGPAPTLKLVKTIDPLFLSPNNVQDGFWPGS